MAQYVREIMNRELFSVEPRAPRQDTLEFLLLLGVSGCPVLDSAGKLVGMVTVRDLVAEEGGNDVRSRISEPVVTVGLDETIEATGRKLSEYHAHSLVVVDEKGRAAGYVSAVDLVAGLVGAPVTHPRVFPHADSASGEIAWSDEADLEPENTDGVPNSAGVIVLIYGTRGKPEVPVWVEAAHNLRARVDDLIGAPQEDSPALAYILARDHGHLRFRTAEVADQALRDRTVGRIQGEIRRRARF